MAKERVEVGRGPHDRVEQTNGSGQSTRRSCLREETTVALNWLPASPSFHH